MLWSSPTSQGDAADIPAKRSGHSLTALPASPFCYLFGGCESTRPPAPSGDIFKLDMQEAETFYWSKVGTASAERPTPRWHHSTVLLSSSESASGIAGEAP